MGQKKEPDPDNKVSFVAALVRQEVVASRRENKRGDEPEQIAAVYFGDQTKWPTPTSGSKGRVASPSESGILFSRSFVAVSPVPRVSHAHRARAFHQLWQIRRSPGAQPPRQVSGVTCPIEFRKVTLDNCDRADGIVVAIDVLRAFTTAAYAFDRGVEEILLVSTVEEAFRLRERFPDCLLIGEVNGRPIDGFDLPNSPTVLEALDLSSRRLILRTTAGTQGIVLSVRADRLFAASLSVASATADCLRGLKSDVVTFVETGVRAKGGGEEDVACADYIASLLMDAPMRSEEIHARVLNSRAAKKFSDSKDRDFPKADLDHALRIDRFAFAMQVERKHDLFVLRSTLEKQ